MNFATTDLTDANPDAPVADPIFVDFGGSRAFAGQIEMAKVFEDNVLVRATLVSPGRRGYWSSMWADRCGAPWSGTSRRASPSTMVG